MELLKKLNKITIFSALVFMLLVSSLPTYAGSTGKISGKILEAATGQPLIGANVILVENPGIVILSFNITKT